MKRKTKFLLKFYLAVVLLTIGFVLTGCDNLPWQNGDNYDVGEENDSVMIAEIVDSKLCPNFNTISGVLNYQQYKLTSNQYDSVFLSLPEKTLIQVTAVLLKQDKPVTVADIASEYLQNRQIYDNLPPPSEDIKEGPNKLDTTSKPHEGPYKIDSAGNVTLKK